MTVVVLLGVWVTGAIGGVLATHRWHRTRTRRADIAHYSGAWTDQDIDAWKLELAVTQSRAAGFHRAWKHAEATARSQAGLLAARRRPIPLGPPRRSPIPTYGAH